MIDAQQEIFPWRNSITRQDHRFCNPSHIAMSTFNYRIPLAVAAFSSLTPLFPAWGQSASNDPPLLKEVQVINTSPLPGIGIEKYKLPYEVQSVDSQAMRKSGSLNMSEFMNENLTGVNVNDIQGSPYQSDVTYRGMRASATLLVMWSIGTCFPMLRLTPSRWFRVPIQYMVSILWAARWHSPPNPA